MVVEKQKLKRFRNPQLPSWPKWAQITKSHNGTYIK